MLRIFEGRNSKVSDLIKMGDFLGHSLRANVNLFSVDSFNKTAIYLSEDDKLIKGNYSIKGGNYLLENVQVEDASVFTDQERFDDYQGNQISLFIESLYNDDTNTAQDHFSGVLQLWEDRARYSNVCEKIEESNNLFNETHNIINTEEAGRFFEMIPSLVSYLQENKEAIESVPEIKNAIKLSETVSKAFNVKTTTYDELGQAGRFEINEGDMDSTYEIICQQELIRREILEAKNNFENVWATEPVIDALASKINSSDEEVEAALFEAICEIPYLALVSKGKLTETINHNLGEFAGTVGVKDMKNFIARIFEMKKQYKEELITVLSEEYGISLQSVKEVPSFKSLLNTQVVIFEALSRVAPKGSNLKKTLSEMSSFLKDKNGVESLDVNAVLQQVFGAAGYSFENAPLFERFTFAEVGEKLEEAAKEKKKDGEDTEKKPEPKEEKPESEDKGKEGDGEEEPTDTDGDEKEKGTGKKASRADIMKSLSKLEQLVSGKDDDGDEDTYDE